MERSSLAHHPPPYPPYPPPPSLSEAVRKIENGRDVVSFQPQCGLSDTQPVFSDYETIFFDLAKNEKDRTVKEHVPRCPVNIELPSLVFSCGSSSVSVCHAVLPSSHRVLSGFLWDRWGHFSETFVDTTGGTGRRAAAAAAAAARRC